MGGALPASQTPTRPGLLMLRLVGAAGLVVAAALATGCDAFQGCTLEARWGISLQLRPVPSPLPSLETVFGWVHDGSFVDSLRFVGVIRREDGVDVALLGAAIERPGLYDVHVRRAGFEPWDSTGVWVRDRRCHVQTVRIDVVLVPG